MAKTKDTLLIEKALEEETFRKRLYGCPEVTIGFFHRHKADEHVDFMTMDSHGIFRCYEIKVSLSDLHSKAKLSFYGHYNYLVVNETLWTQKEKWINEINKDVGVILAKKYLSFVSNNKESSKGVDAIKLEVVKNPTKKNLTDSETTLLKESLIRSLYWKMEKFKASGNIEEYRQIKTENRHLTSAYKEESRERKTLERKHHDLLRYLLHYKNIKEEEIEEFI